MAKRLGKYVVRPDFSKILVPDFQPFPWTLVHKYL